MYDIWYTFGGIMLLFAIPAACQNITSFFKSSELNLGGGEGRLFPFGVAIAAPPCLILPYFWEKSTAKKHLDEHCYNSTSDGI